jgi:hypothetical protein
MCGRDDDTSTFDARCPACGDLIDYCPGHGEIGDPAGFALLSAHDDGDHDGCSPHGCPEAPDPFGDTMRDIRARARRESALRAADGRVYSLHARAVEDRVILLAEIDRLTKGVAR